MTAIGRAEGCPGIAMFIRTAVESVVKPSIATLGANVVRLLEANSLKVSLSWHKVIKLSSPLIMTLAVECFTLLVLR
jgi:hypothetical protein